MMRYLTPIILALALLVGCETVPTDPNAPQMTDEQRQVMQLNQALDSVDVALLVADVYVSTKKDEWDVEKVDKYKDLIDKARLAVGVARGLLAEGNVTSAASQKIIIDAIMEALDEEAEASPGGTSAGATSAAA